MLFFSVVSYDFSVAIPIPIRLVTICHVRLLSISIHHLARTLSDNVLFITHACLHIMYVSVRMYVCVYVCACVCMYIGMYVCIYLCMYCMHVCVCVHARTYVLKY